MHWTYEKRNRDNLFQGDVLERSESLNAVLEEIHPHYHSNTNNKYFIVLTQTCDLARRGSSGCKARYIHISPVRDVDLIIDRIVGEFSGSDFSPHGPVYSAKLRNQLYDYFTKLFNNNIVEYFYLHKDLVQEFTTNCCAILNLSIPLKTEYHYQTCLDAKTLQLTEAFRAKLGWHVGQIYSRIATDDWKQVELKELVTEQLEKSGFFVPHNKRKIVFNKLDEWKEARPSESLDAITLADIVSSIPSDKKLMIDKVEEIIRGFKPIQDLLDAGMIKDTHIDKLLQRIKDDTKISALLSEK